LATASALLVAGCGGGSATGPAASDQSTVPAGQGGNQANSEFGLPEAEIVKRVDAVEALIATCMKDAGFEYIAVDYATARKAMDTNSKPGGMNPDQFLAEYGYGITTLVAGADAQAAVGLSRNAAIRDGLPPADQIAWDRQLLGENTNQTFVVGLDREDMSPTGGCTRTAVEKNFSKAELGPGFVNYQNADSARIDQDPRVIAAYNDWSNCMRTAGFSYGISSDIKSDLALRLDALKGSRSVDELDAASTAALAQLQGEERAISAADHQCELDNVADIKAKVQAELLGPSAGN